MEVCEELSDPRAEDALEWHGGLLDHGHLGAEPARRRRGLAADPARADDHEPSAWTQCSPQPVGVGDGAQDVDAVATRSLDRWPPRCRPGRDQQPVVAQLLAVGQGDAVGARVQCGRARGRQQLDPLVRVEALIVYVRFGELAVARQVCLRQRRALVGQVRFVGDQDDAPVEALLAQRLCGLGACQTAAHDCECLSVRHDFLR
jgi:hypothetical protein